MRETHIDGWRSLSFEVGSAATQLDRTDALWQDVAAGRAGATLRWYGYDSTALVLGVGQHEADVDVATAGRERVAVVKRTSGGTTVLADQHMLALDVALPAAPGAIFADVVESYRWLGDAFLNALQASAPHAAHRLSLVTPAEARADQASQRAAPGASAEHRRAMACFGTLSPYEVALVDPGTPARKLVGLSQVRKRGVVLFQAGLYLRFAGADLALFLPPHDPTLAAELDRRIAALDALGIDDPVIVTESVSRAIAKAAPSAVG